MNKNLFLLFFVSFIFSQVYVDVVTLNNGDIIKGKIIENKINEYIKIELSGGSILSYEYSSILKIDVEEINTRTFGQQAYQHQNQSRGTSIANCFNDGYQSGLRIDTQGNMWGGYGSGFLLGLIGMGISYAIVSAQDPIPPLHEINSFDESCKSDYLRGYREGALKQKKSANLWGGTLGVLTIVIVSLSVASDY